MRWLCSIRDQLRASWWGRVLAEHDTEPTELSGGLLKVSLAIWLLLPPTAIGPAFGFVALIPELYWSIFLLVVGVGHLVALRNGHPAWRRWGCLVGFFVWCSLAVTLLVNGVVGIGPVLFIGAGLSQGWCYIRLGYLQ